MILDQVFYLLDIDETPLRALPLSAEYKLEDLQDSTNRLELRLPLQASGRVVTDQQLVFRGRRFTILGLGFDKDTSEIILTADELQARLADVNNPTFVLKKETLPQAMAKAVAKAAGWTVGDVFETVLNYNAELKNISSLFSLRFLERQSGGRLFFDSGKKIIHMRKGDETIADVVFRYGKNVANITKEQTSPQATVLFPYGRDGMTIEANTGGKKFIEDFSWYIGLGMTLEDARKKYTKELVWSDDRYIYNSNLYRDAVKRLAVLSRPQINYKLSNAQAANVELGQLAYVHDEDLDIRVLVVVSKIIRSSNPEENEIELDYIPPSLGAGLDNGYSGDTNQGGSGDTSLFLQKNQSIVTLNNTDTIVVSADLTVFSPTAFEMGLAVMIEITAGGLLEGYFTIDSDRLPTQIKQTVAPGWYTIGLPFIVTGVQEGTKTLRFYMKFGGTGSGAARIDKERAEFFVKASGVYGGATNDKPDQTILEEITIPTFITMSDSAIEFRDLPRLFNPVESVPITIAAPVLVENYNVFLDPPPVGSPPPAPLSDTQIREEFADMRNYSQPTRPTQFEADRFINSTHSEANHFAILASEFTVYLIASYGSYIDIDFPTPGNPIITSDDDLYISYGPNNVYRGLSIDWSVNNPNPYTVTERYSVPEPTAPGEAGPPRRLQTQTDYSITETVLVYTPGAGDRITTTPVEVGGVYRVTRGYSSTVFVVAFATAAPQFNETAEPIVTGYALKEPGALEIDAEAPAGATHMIIYEQGAELAEVVVQLVAPQFGTNIFNGDYQTRYYPDASGLVYEANDNLIGLVIPVRASSFYHIERAVTSTRFRIAFLTREPLFNGTNEGLTILASPTEILDAQTGTRIFYRTAPIGATYLFVQISNTGERPAMDIHEIEEIPKTGESYAQAIPLTVPSRIDYEVNSVVNFRHFKVTGLTIGNSYAFENFPDTAGRGHDTYMFLNDVDTEAQISADDDGGATGNYSKITWTATKTAVYVRMRHYSQGAQGFAALDVIQL